MRSGKEAGPDGLSTADKRPEGPRRALVALAPSRPSEAPFPYRQAPFLAHLLAVKDQHAQTRERRRAEPQEATAAYRATAGLIP